ncbi:MAG: hypothetical protein ACAI34_14230 [Verrucomicrobium sp.]|nr:hypothetical protein [Verrucomicrobium sp.]
MKTSLPWLSSILTLGFCLGSTELLRADSRTFTSADGRKLVAEIVGATPDTVSLKLADGSTATLPLIRLAEEDREVIGQWRKANPQAIRYNFTVDWTDECVSGKKRARGNGPAIVEAKEKWVCHFKVLNRSGMTLENVELRYQIHYVSVDGKAQTSEVVKGRKAIPAVKFNDTAVVDSDVVELDVMQLAPGFTWADPKMRRKENDDIKGVVVTLYHDGKQVHEFVSRGITKTPDDLGKPVSKPR